MDRAGPLATTGGRVASVLFESVGPRVDESRPRVRAALILGGPRRSSAPPSRWSRSAIFGNDSSRGGQTEIIVGGALADGAHGRVRGDRHRAAAPSPLPFSPPFQ